MTHYLWLLESNNIPDYFMYFLGAFIMLTVGILIMNLKD